MYLPNSRYLPEKDPDVLASGKFVPLIARKTRIHMAFICVCNFIQGPPHTRHYIKSPYQGWFFNVKSLINLKQITTYS